MKKEKAFIVLSHTHRLEKNGQWQVYEKVEIVDQLRKRHYSNSSAIGDFINRTMISGIRVGMDNYDNFENYIRNRYKTQMDELDTMYKDHRVNLPENKDLMVDEFGNVREKTIFDV